MLVVIVSALLIMSGQLWAQSLDDLKEDYTSQKPSFSLFDPSRFNMSHSYSLWYSSSRAGSQSLAMYLNSIEYQISDPLKIRVDIGYLHSPGTFFKGGGVVQGGDIMPALSISWRPSQNLYFSFDYRQAPVIYSRDRSGYFNPYIWEGR